MNIEGPFGLALCGGGARGMAHVGLLRVLEENGLKPSYIAGTSAGAIVASMYASGVSTEMMMQVSEGFSMVKLVTKGINRSAMTDLKYLEQMLTGVGVKPNFAETNIPCFIGVTDILTGEPVYLSQGNLPKAVKASSSIPGIFKPVEIEGTTYVDGGLVENLPAKPLIDKVKTIIGCNVNALSATEVPTSLPEVTNRTLEIVMARNSVQARAACAFVFDLEAVYEYDMYDFGQSPEIIVKGYQDASRIFNAELKAAKSL